jgi:hypothetical protein
VYCVFLIFYVFAFCKPYSRSNSICVSFSMFFRFLAIFQVLHCALLIIHIFSVSHHSPGPTILIFHFFSVFLAIFNVLPCEFLNFLVGQFYRYNPGPTVCISQISCFSLFLAIFQVLLCMFLILHVFQCFSPYSWSYSVDFSFFTFFSVSRRIAGQTVFVSHFPRFFSFLAIIHVLQCVFLMIHVFHCFSPFSKSYSVCVSFSSFVSFLAIFQVLQYIFLIFQIFQCFSAYSR